MKLFNFNAWGHALGFLFFGGLFILAAGFTLTTTQMLFEHGFTSLADVHYSYDVLWQLWNALQGDYSGVHLIAVIISWVLLSCYVAANGIKKWIRAGIAHEGLEMFCHFMVALDGVANWVYLAQYAWYYQLIFIFGVYIVLAHFGKIAVSHLTLAFHGFMEE